MPLTTCRRAHARGRFLITMTLRSNPSFFFHLYRNFALLFTIFLHFWSFYGILTCFAQNNTVIISAFLQLFPIIYKFYGKTAFCKKLCTVILFERLPPTQTVMQLRLIFLKVMEKPLDTHQNPWYDSKGTKSRVIHSHLAAIARAMVKPIFSYIWMKNFCG